MWLRKAEDMWLRKAEDLWLRKAEDMWLRKAEDMWRRKAEAVLFCFFFQKRVKNWLSCGCLARLVVFGGRSDVGSVTRRGREFNPHLLFQRVCTVS